MLFPALTAALLITVVLVLVYPLLRRRTTALVVGEAAALDEERVNLDIERQTLVAALADLEVDFGQGKIAAADYNRLKLGHEHRLITVLDRLDALKKAKPSRRGRPPQGKQPGVASPSLGKTWAMVAVLGVFVVTGATGVYKLVHWQFERKATASDEGMPAAMPINPEEMVARLEKRLQENPDDLQGQIMAGRSYMALQRWGDAKRAWNKVLELDPRNYTAHYRLGEILLSEPSGGGAKVAEEALAHFDKALISVPQDASVLWAKGIALLQLGRISEADEAWTEAYQYIPPETDSARMVKKALADLRAGRLPTSE